MKPVVLVAALLLLVLPSKGQTDGESRAAQPFWGDLHAGPYPVGFRVLYRRDEHRRWLKKPDPATDPGRPIRVSVWYPASSSRSNKRMTYGDYLHHSGPAEYRALNERLDKLDTESWLSDLRELTSPGQPMFQKLLATPAAAYRDAPPAQGHFPLVLYSGGKGSRADDNLELGEYLASYGYVVATVPELGPSNEELELGSSPREISLHADDFDAALPALHRLRDIDFDHIATAGHSAGGEAAVELALRHPQVRAVVGLDASYGMTSGVRIFRQLPEYASGRQVGAALLDVRRAEGSQGVKLDLSAIDALHWTDVYRIAFQKAYHGDFTEWGLVAWKLSIPMPPNPYGHTRQIGYRVNRLTCRAVLDFLEAELRGRSDAVADLTQTMQHEPGVAFTHTSAHAQ
jgi:Chlorophyllase